MAEREDGEFEIILGNKQLLSVLFMVIVLLGVFFAMGFLAGRSTAGGTVVAKNEKAPLPLERQAPAAKSAEPAAPVEEKAAQPATPEPAAKEEPRKSEPAKNEAAKPEKVAEKKADKKPEPKAEPPKSEAKKAPEPARGSGVFVENPPAGTYLQAAATRRADAESMLGYIGKETSLRGFVAPSPKSAELFRVLVGPLKGSEEIAGARTKLGEIGIKTPYIVKY